MWIVMTASAHMPSTCRGKYRKVALVEVKDPADMPSRIDERDRRIVQVRHQGNHHFGKTDRGAYQRALARANAECIKLNEEEQQ